MKVIDLYSAGLPIKSIARDLGISAGHVGRLLRANGYTPIRIGGTRLTPAQLSKAVEMHKSGHSWRAISREIGPHDKTIKRAVENYAAQRANE